MSSPSERQGAGHGRADGRLHPHPATRAAHRLRRALEWHGITAEVHEGRGLALASVCVDLVAWTDGACYFWWSGEVSETTGRRTYAYSPADDPVTAARRVAERHRDLRDGRSRDALSPEGLQPPVPRQQSPEDRLLESFRPV
ncbi:hypothetical protein [Sphaerisporangium dianthi]|uniref:Uncharacterized protein n=1 Tax=Sphaerisporangium dianthi TaxID=1436120 RepID=A0ABV9CQL0_9ACTN